MASKNERELLRVKKLLKEVNDLREQFGEGKMSINFDNASAESLKSNFKELTDYAVKYKVRGLSNTVTHSRRRDTHILTITYFTKAASHR